MGNHLKRGLTIKSLGLHMVVSPNAKAHFLSIGWLNETPAMSAFLGGYSREGTNDRSNNKSIKVQHGEPMSFWAYSPGTGGLTSQSWITTNFHPTMENDSWKLHCEVPFQLALSYTLALLDHLQLWEEHGVTGIPGPVALPSVYQGVSIALFPLPQT